MSTWAGNTEGWDRLVVRRWMSADSGDTDLGTQLHGMSLDNLLDSPSGLSQTPNTTRTSWEHPPGRLPRQT
uniref:Uncharacterized protein n=1 Tax=Bubo bubo TaxID=30461 RepID=A0A8C0ESP9_BUBBB